MFVHLNRRNYIRFDVSQDCLNLHASAFMGFVFGLRETMLIVGLTVVACVVGILAVDRIVSWVLPLVGPILPDVFCGPEGWFVDTQSESGIFDRTSR